MNICFRTLLLALACSTSAAFAQDQFNTNNTFGGSKSIAGWDYWYGGAGQSVTWDGAMDAATNSHSGSMKVQVSSDSEYGQASFRGTFSGTADNGGYGDYSTAHNGANYTFLDMDINVSTNSPSAGGKYGGLQLGFYTGGDGPNQYAGITVTNYVPTTPGWVHLHAPIAPTLNTLPYITGIWIQNNLGNFTGTNTFWVDNIRLEPGASQPVAGATGLTPVSTNSTASATAQ